jgi:hypothetical protein
MKLEDLLVEVTPEVHELFHALRNLIIQKLPAATEEIDAKARMTAYSLFSGYAGTVFTLMVAKKWVTLGIYQGARLPDPQHLFSGSGKIHGSIKFSDLSQVNSDSLAALLEAAVAAAKDRLQTIGNANV